MSWERIITRYGPEAHDALASLVQAAKQGDALQQVTVVVPNNPVSVAARRSLGRRGGVAAISFLTVYGLAELLGSRRVAAGGKRPVWPALIAAAVRQALRQDPGALAGVENNPTTEQALVRAHRELSELGSCDLDRLARESSRASHVVRIHRAVSALLQHGFSNEQQLLAAATQELDELDKDSPLARQLGKVVLFLPQRLSQRQADLLKALGRAGDHTVIAASTGLPSADRTVSQSLEYLGLDLDSAAPNNGAAITPAIADRVISVSDAEDEVRQALRGIVAAARDGIHLGRCAILYSAPVPYARLIKESLDNAELSWSGATMTTAENCLLGRSLLALLDLPDRDLARRDVMAWLAMAPVRGNDGWFVPEVAWERTARAAGVRAGIAEWQDRLDNHATELESQAEELAETAGDEKTQWRIQRNRSEAERARDLLKFINKLHADFDPGAQTGSWKGLAKWCRRLVRTYLGAAAGRQKWPADEQSLAEAVDEAIDRLGELGDVDPNPSVVAFRRALATELEQNKGRRGRLGEGVLVGQISTAVGLELDRVIVCGMAEGAFPAHHGDDALLPDRERKATRGNLVLREERVDEQHRALLAVLAAAEHSTLLYPRGDLRRSAFRLPSRWLLDTVQAREGLRPKTEDLNRRTGPWLTEVPSFVAGLRATAFPTRRQEYDMRVMLDSHEAKQSLENAALATERIELQRAVELIEARRSPKFTRFDGNLRSDGDLRGMRLPDPYITGSPPGRSVTKAAGGSTSDDVAIAGRNAADGSVVVSATSLEKWSKCPHGYFVEHVLGVKPLDDPEENHRTSPLVRGSLFHDILNRWLSEAIEAEAVPGPEQPWPDHWRDRLLRIGEERCDHVEARGQVGRTLYWRRDRRLILTDLEAFIGFDDRKRQDLGSTPIGSEVAFGMPRSPVSAVTIPIAESRAIRLRGSIDRLDQTNSGNLVVIDYKTGKSTSYSSVKLDTDNPTPQGLYLQLVLYALAARAHRNAPDAEVLSYYWFVSKSRVSKSRGSKSRGSLEDIGYPVNKSTEKTALGTIDSIVTAIGSGVFPQHPRERNWGGWIDCHFCDPDGLGTRQQRRDWQRKRNDPEMFDYVKLIDPELAGASGNDSTGMHTPIGSLDG